MTDERVCPARRYGILVRTGMGAALEPGHVVRFLPRRPVEGSVVPLYRDHQLSKEWIAEADREGIPLGLATLGTVDELTDLLSRLRALGVSHVCFDPRAGRHDLIPIAVAIVRLQVAG